MICPADRQPCTMDHSESCWHTCEASRLAQRQAASDEVPPTKVRHWLYFVSLPLLIVVLLMFGHLMGWDKQPPPYVNYAERDVKACIARGGVPSFSTYSSGDVMKFFGCTEVKP